MSSKKRRCRTKRINVLPCKAVSRSDFVRRPHTQHSNGMPIKWPGAKGLIHSIQMACMSFERAIQGPQRTSYTAFKWHTCLLKGPCKAIKGPCQALKVECRAKIAYSFACMSPSAAHARINSRGILPAHRCLQGHALPASPNPWT